MANPSLIMILRGVFKTLHTGSSPAQTPSHDAQQPSPSLVPDWCPSYARDSVSPAPRQPRVLAPCAGTTPAWTPSRVCAAHPPVQFGNNA
eukprot:351675-Chlamydomonas_euryale.AAC.1